jgi:hypothetical protein
MLRLISFMALTTGTRNVYSWLAVGLAPVFTILGSVALFALVQNARPYVELIRGQFYTPVANSSETILYRAFSPTALVILRWTLWPAVLFILLEVGAACSVSKLVHLEGRFAATRRLLAAFGLSLLMTVVLLAPMWWLLERLATRVRD